MNRANTENTKKEDPLQSDSIRLDTPAILLVGGLGTRLQSVLPSTPKPLAPIGNMSFLQLLVMQLRSQGIQRIVMCTGHLADKIEEEFGDGHKWDVVIDYSKESSPLGTAGAVKLAEHYINQSSDFLVMNGDSFLQLDIPEFIRFHREHGGLISMAVRNVADAARYGTVDLDTHGRVIGFREKTGGHGTGIVNGGVYMFNRAVLTQIREGASSLEMDVFPRSLGQGVFALEQDGMFIDIGTPEDYARAQELGRSLYKAVQPRS